MKTIAAEQITDMGLGYRESGRCWFIHGDNPHHGVYIAKTTMNEAMRKGTVREVVSQSLKRLPGGCRRIPEKGRTCST